MKQLCIISGKGGTGKTVMSAAFIALSGRCVAADCDVDAADLHLLLHPEIKEKKQFKGLKEARIDNDRCTGCGLCYEVCRYNAVEKADKYKIDPLSCEGCRVCYYTCPFDAINMEDRICGEWYVSDTKYGPMVHAKLGIAQENSGKLVTHVKERANSIAKDGEYDIVIIDGPPGIGCPVISSLAGVDMALVVTEPTLSAVHDMKRVIDVARHFNIDTACVINKYDINCENSRQIGDWCLKNKVPLLGSIPFDKSVTESVIEGIPIVEYADNDVSREINMIWKRISVK